MVLSPHFPPLLRKSPQSDATEIQFKGLTLGFNGMRSDHREVNACAFFFLCRLSVPSKHKAYKDPGYVSSRKHTVDKGQRERGTHPRKHIYLLLFDMKVFTA